MPYVPEDSVNIRLLGQGEEAVLANVAAGVFDNPIKMHCAREFLADPRHHIVVAIIDGQVVGFASALHYVHPDKEADFWVNEVGVDDAFQNRGIGRRLLAALFEHAKSHGCYHAWVATEKHNNAARRLYEVAGGVEDADDIVMADFDLGKSSDSI